MVRSSSWAAVSIVWVGHGPAASVLLVQRTARRGDPWSGDMAFPGGLGDAADADPLATARRETREEVGLELPMPIRTLPSLRILHPGRRGLLRLVPYVFRLPERPALTLEPREIAAAHWVPCAHLRAHRRWRLLRVRGWVPWIAPVRRWEGTRIWGLTGRMVDDLLTAIPEA